MRGWEGLFGRDCKTWPILETHAEHFMTQLLSRQTGRSCTKGFLRRIIILRWI